MTHIFKKQLARSALNSFKSRRPPLKVFVEEGRRPPPSVAFALQGAGPPFGFEGEAPLPFFLGCVGSAVPRRRRRHRRRHRRRRSRRRRRLKLRAVSSGPTVSLRLSNAAFALSLHMRFSQFPLSNDLSLTPMIMYTNLRAVTVYTERLGAQH